MTDDADAELRAINAYTQITPPAYVLRAGFITASHGEIAPGYTQAQLSSAFHFRDMAGGVVPADDVLQVDYTRDSADVFNRMTVGNGTFFLDNAGGAYSPASRAAYVPGQPIALTAQYGNFDETWTGNDDDVWSVERWHDVHTKSNDDITALPDDSVADIQSNAGRLFAEGGTYRYAWIATKATTFADFDLTAKLVIPTITGEQFHAVNVRAAGGRNDASAVRRFSGYSFNLSIHTGNFYVRSSVAGIEGPTIDNAGKTYAVGTWYIRIQALGSALKGKLWQETEPAAWDLEITNTDHVIGDISIGAQNGADAVSKSMVWDDLVVRGVVKPLFTGRITAFTLTAELGRRVARIEAEDRAAWLRRRVSIPMMIDTVTSSMATEILLAAGFEQPDIDIDTQADDPIAFSLLDDVKAGEAINELIQAGGHYAYVDGGGRFVFKDRTFDFFATTVTSIGAFESFGYSLSIDRQLNDVRVVSAPRKVSTTPQTVAFLEDVPSIPASGTSLAFFVNWQDVTEEGQSVEQAVPVTSLTTPVASTDWQLNTQADGGGTDLTSAGVLDFAGFARSGLVTVTNCADQTGHLSKFNVRGHPVRTLPTFGAVAADSASVAAGTVDKHYDFTVETQLISDIAFAQAYADLILANRINPVPVIDISLRNQWPLMLHVDMLDRLVVQEDISSINTAWTVRGIDHSITMNPGMAHTARYRLEVSEQRLYLVLDDDPRGKLDADRILAP